jgi:TRAP-type uncharacterized transport system substrate-binding protein
MAASSAEEGSDLIALVLARPEIKSLADLAGKRVAIDDRHGSSNRRVHNALAAAGAAEIQLHDGRNTAIDELVDDRVSTAVLTWAPHDAADAFPSITGFNLFKVPLSQSSTQDKAASP